MWSMGPAGTEIPITVLRDTTRHELAVASVERMAHLRKGTVQ